ncbi:DNA polymerase eta [Alternaria panax]|uniref:DNA polymerase eta n=1 Tax=Alternaria panax TaxID=48097 RepID=A0AAD4IH81_9PLEO|nr:DNA polymerase eta [Alternaria panax]
MALVAFGLRVVPLLVRTAVSEYTWARSGDSVKGSVSQYTYRDLDELKKFSPRSPLRIIALIDFDAFYAQCEVVRLRLQPSTPLAVQQWNAIIALNYPARESGLKRGASIEEARRLCPEIVLQHVATWREGETTWAYRPDVTKHMATDKSALDPYRLQSRKCFEFIRSLLADEPVQRVEKASIDEVFLDLSAQVHQIMLRQFPELAEQPDDLEQYLPSPNFSSLLDWAEDYVVDVENADPRPDWDDIALNIGAGIVRRIRAEVLIHFGYTCSAGISRNKVVAKLGAGFKKPNQQTVIPTQATCSFLAKHIVKLTKIRGLGGKLGQQVIASFGSDRVDDILRIPIEDLKAKLGKESGCWVYDVVRGREWSVVTSRLVVQSMPSAKTFVPSVGSFEQAMKWLRIFAADLMGRLTELQSEYPRQPTVVALHHHINGRFGPTRSKQATIPSGSRVDEMAIFAWSKALLRQVCDEGVAWPCASLSISISGFQPLVSQNHRITSFFTTEPANGKRLSDACEEDEGKQQGLKRICTGAGHETALEEMNSTCASSKTDRMGSLRNKSHDLQAESMFSYDCPKCSQSIQATQVLEHLDWHTALEMQESGE